MKYFEDVTLMTSEINKLGIEMLEGLLTEDKARLNKVYETMKELVTVLQEMKSKQTEMSCDLDVLKEKIDHLN